MDRSAIGHRQLNPAPQAPTLQEPLALHTSLRRPRLALGICETTPQAPGASFLLQDLGLTQNSCPQSPQVSKRSLCVLKTLFYIFNCRSAGAAIWVHSGCLRSQRKPEGGSHLASIKQIFRLSIDVYGCAVQGVQNICSQSRWMQI